MSEYINKNIMKIKCLLQASVFILGQVLAFFGNTWPLGRKSSSFLGVNRSRGEGRVFVDIITSASVTTGSGGPAALWLRFLQTWASAPAPCCRPLALGRGLALPCWRACLALFSPALLLGMTGGDVFSPAAEWLEMWLFWRWDQWRIQRFLHNTLWGLFPAWESWRQNRGNV